MTDSPSQAMLRVEVWRGADTGHFQTFEVARRANQTVLDVVTAIQREQDASLAYRFACRVGMCGSCAMVVNGTPRWTCRTRVDLVAGAKATLRLEPLRNMRVVKDLAVDMTRFFDKLRDAKGYFEPSGQPGDDFAVVAAIERAAPGGRRRHRVHRLRRVHVGLRRDWRGNRTTSDRPRSTARGRWSMTCATAATTRALLRSRAIPAASPAIRI